MAYCPVYGVTLLELNEKKNGNQPKKTITVWKCISREIVPSLEMFKTK